MIIAKKKKTIKKHFNKNLVMSAKDEKRFQSSNKCWICNKIFDVEDQRNHCHLTVNNKIIFFNRVLRNRKN